MPNDPNRLPKSSDDQYLPKDLAALCTAAEGGQATPLAAIEAGFLAVTEYRRQLSPAGNTTDPVGYFKYTWASVQGAIRFYELAYYLERFRPRGTIEDRRRFWLYEADRRLRYIAQHEELYTYFAEARCDRDDELFKDKPAQAAINSTRFAEFIALDRYDRYLSDNFGRFFAPVKV